MLRRHNVCDSQVIRHILHHVTNAKYAFIPKVKVRLRRYAGIIGPFDIFVYIRHLFIYERLKLG